MTHNPYNTQSNGLPPSPRPNRRQNWITMMGVWVIVFLLVWNYVRSNQPSPLHTPDAKPQAVTPRGDLMQDERETIEVFREASPAVVYINTSDFGRGFLGLNVLEIPRGTGSGFVYDRSGHIVTNYHVVQDADKIVVTLADQSQWEARRVGIEPDKDIAVLKIDAPADQLTPLSIGESNDLQVGQRVLAIGNPFGFDNTLTVGVVSALGRDIRSMTGRRIRDVIQTDAAINPGNSGGPLLDSAGRLIGINTQIASPSGVSAGIGFAVPVDTVNEIVPELIRYGIVHKPALGIVAVDDRLARRIGIRGVLIDSVAENGGAAKAGLRGTLVDQRGYVRQLGDIIIKVGETPTYSLVDLKDALDSYHTGDRVDVVYIRDDRTANATIELKVIE